ncbi:MAG TPA: ATP synthase subunit I [Burkholderiales bacterium]|jgi:ATP synthase protein I|nr:ATP synthase subunit I [Burkholderiales bacterium]
MLRRLSKPIRTVMRWQAAATLAMTLMAALALGMHGAISAAAGGAISLFAGAVAGWVASRSHGGSAGGVLVGALRAEAIKIGVSVLLLWLVLKNYDQAIVGVFVGSFVVTMLIFTMAFFVREY